MPVIRENYREIRNRMQPGDVIAFSGNRIFSTVIKLVTSSHVSHVGVIVPPDCLENEVARDDPVIAESTETGVAFRWLSNRVHADEVEMLWWLPLSPTTRRRLNVEALRESVCAHGTQGYDYLQAAMLGLTLLEPTLNTINPGLDDAIRGFLLNRLSRDPTGNSSLGNNIRNSLLRTLDSIREADFDNRIGYDVIRLLLADRTPETLSRQIENEEDLENFFCSELAAAGLEAAGVLSAINASEVTPIDLCRFNIYQDRYFQFKGEELTTIRGFNSINPLRWEG